MSGLDITQLNKEMLIMKEDITKLSERLDTHVESEAERFGTMIDAVNQNTKSIKTLTDETKTIVQLHKDFTGAARIGGGIQSFLLWCVKWGAIGTFFGASINWIIKHWSS